MTSAPHGSGRDLAPGLHIATLTYEGRIWDAYLEFEDDPRRPTLHRARLRFDPADGTPEMAARTTVIIIEDTHEAAIHKARSFEGHQLQGLLRSCLPDEGGG